MTKDNLLMWAHYSDEHRGAVIGIDIGDSNFVEGSKGYQYQKEVHYTSARPDVPPKGSIPIEHLFTKSREWGYEKEYRIIRELRYGTPKTSVPKLQDIVLFDLSPGCIKHLIFGVRREKQKRKQIIDRISRSPELEHISLWQADLDPDGFKLRIDPVPKHS